MEIPGRYYKCSGIREWPEAFPTSPQSHSLKRESSFIKKKCNNVIITSKFMNDETWTDFKDFCLLAVAVQIEKGCDHYRVKTIGYQV